MKGKNYSGNSNKDRPSNDYYGTHYSLTRQLLEVENFNKNLSILEPCSGKDLAIVKVLEENKFSNITHYDLCYGDVKKDFFTETNTFDYCISNPPYKLAYEFILHLKKVINKKFALFLPLNYLHGQKRYENIFQDKKFKLSKVYVFTRYPMMGVELREDGMYPTGMTVFSYMIWDKETTNEKPTIDWIDNNKYVIGSNKKQKGVYNYAELF